MSMKHETLEQRPVDIVTKCTQCGVDYRRSGPSGVPDGVCSVCHEDESAARHTADRRKWAAEMWARGDDAVNHPTHYTSGAIECIDALDAATVNKTGIEAICTANAIKYLWRYESKGGAEDVRKARWYIDRLLAALEPGQ